MARAIRPVKDQRREVPAGAGDPQHKATAYKARADYKWGRAIAKAIEDGSRQYDELSQGEKKAHGLFHRGVLTKVMFEANKAWGYGKGTTPAESAEKRAMKQLSLRSEAGPNRTSSPAA